MKIEKLLAAVVFATASGAALAEPTRVEAVQYPAWLERGGHAVPLTPGTVLVASDQIRTGANARVQVKMGEGSTVKLGENAKLVIEKVEDRLSGLFELEDSGARHQVEESPSGRFELMKLPQR